jgi:hypothetical protein
MKVKNILGRWEPTSINAQSLVITARQEGENIHVRMDDTTNLAFWLEFDITPEPDTE